MESSWNKKTIRLRGPDVDSKEAICVEMMVEGISVTVERAGRKPIESSVFDMNTARQLRDFLMYAIDDESRIAALEAE